ncbi:MAG: hypothetical protein ACR2NJ_01235, partial [Acidimicrobiales bacterium]
VGVPASVPALPAAKALTWRVAGFVAAFLAVLALAAGGIGWYARAGYFVGLHGNQLVIYQGRPGGVLWIGPTVARNTGVSTVEVESRHLDELHAGKTEASLGQAQRYVDNLRREYATSQAGGVTIGPATTAPGATTPGATTPGATTAPGGATIAPPTTR